MQITYLQKVILQKAADKLCPGRNDMKFISWRNGLWQIVNETAEVGDIVTGEIDEERILRTEL